MRKEKEESIKAIGDKYLPKIKNTCKNILKSEEEIIKFNQNAESQLSKSENTL